jgi:hypothetical protein
MLASAKSGYKPVTLASGQAWPNGLAMDEHCIWWVNESTGAIMTMMKRTRLPPPL